MFFVWYVLRVLAVVAVVFLIALAASLLAPFIGMLAAKWVAYTVGSIICLPIIFWELIQTFRSKRTT